jgi:two-component system cell cycle response regulator
MDHLQPPAPSDRRSLILLVDDSATQAQRTRFVLEAAGYAVETCPNGAMALAAAAALPVDLILLDIYLPDLNGREVAQRLKADPILAGIPIIFVTGVFRDVEDIVLGLEQGAVDYLCKPVQDGELIARIRASLRAKETQRELARLARQLLTVNQVGNQLAGILDLDLLLKSVVALMFENFGYPHVHLYLLKDDELVLAAAAGENASTYVLAGPRLRLAGDSLAAVSARSLQLTTLGEGVSPRHPFIPAVRTGAAMPLRSAGVVTGVLEILSPAEWAISANDGLVLQTIADIVGVAVQNSVLYRQMEDLAMVDDLTGLLNRRTLLARLNLEWSRCQRFTHDLSLMVLDIDHFKQINDSHGHSSGDRVLQLLAQVLQRSIRQIDSVGRLGGDEFLLILPETGPEGALEVADRLSKAIDLVTLPTPMVTPVHFSVSVGIATWPQSAASSVTQLLHHADQALYRAKAGGRHRVEH